MSKDSRYAQTGMDSERHGLSGKKFFSRIGVQACGLLILSKKEDFTGGL